MGKGGGAGKVYFVLYLAVVLELLIIIVERDEAEEHLHKKTQEAMRIVESILTQLQSGSGTEGINTRPQDEIMIPPAGVNIKEAIGVDIKPSRKYIVEVGVTDISSALAQREGETGEEYRVRLEKLIALANVEQLEYQVFFNTSEDPLKVPPFPSDKSITKQVKSFVDSQEGTIIIDDSTGTQWKFLGAKELNLDKDATFNALDLTNLNADQIRPVYPDNLKRIVGQNFQPSGISDDSLFYYSESESIGNVKVGNQELKKRAFVVNFQPPNQAGWYKLRFTSRTNRILGIRKTSNTMKAEDVPDDATVNIGTVQLSVGDLRKVRKEISQALEKFDLPPLELLENGDADGFNHQLEEAKKKAQTDDEIGKINLYGYIIKLLVPGQGANFIQNRSSIQFDIRVTTPKPPVAQPTVSIAEYIPSFDKVNPVFDFDISPYQGSQNTVEGRVTDMSGNTVSRLELRPLDQIAGLNISTPNNGDKRAYRASVEKVLPPGKYKVEVTHKLFSKTSSPNTTTLEVFPSKLTDESLKEVSAKLRYNVAYGARFICTFEPTSGGKIASNQFRILPSTDKDQQMAARTGLTVPLENPIVFSPPSTKFNLRVVWSQPVTNKEVILFDQTDIPIQQDPPQVFANNITAPSYSGTAQRFKVRVSGIKVLAPQASANPSDPKAQVDVKMGEAKKADGLSTYNFATEPALDGDATNYSIEFEMQGKLEPGQRDIRGTIEIPIRAIATNPITGTKSDISTGTVKIQIAYTPERGGGRRPR